MDNLYLALTVIFPLFCMMSLGYFLQRINVLDKPFVKKLNLLCFNAFLPLVIFLNIYNSDFYSLFSPKLRNTTHTQYSHIIHGFLHISCVVPQNYTDPLLLHFPTVQHPLDRLFHALCRMRSEEVLSMQGHTL